MNTRILLILISIFVSSYCYAFEKGVPKKNQLVFDIMRKNKIIGSHSIVFHQKDDLLNVNINVDIKVKFGFLTVYKYKHKNNEIWKNGQLLKITTKSITNSKKEYQVQGEQKNNNFEFNGVDGEKNTYKDIIPISYWHSGLLNSNEFFDTQKGIIRNSKVILIGKEEINFQNKIINTNKYELSILTKHPSDEKPFPIIFLWYTEDSELMKLQFDSPEDNSIIDYIRVK